VGRQDPLCEVHSKHLYEINSATETKYYYYYLLLLLFTAIGVSPGGSSPYTSTHNTNMHICKTKV
jgi:hypothetical protein